MKCFSSSMEDYGSKDEKRILLNPSLCASHQSIATEDQVVLQKETISGDE